MFNAHFLGKNNFVWWIGVVENRKDPLNVGRCQVRIIGWHSENKSLLPTEQLPWAQPVLPLNDSSVIPPKEGTMVMGFFLDGEGGQHPIMMGQISGIPDTKPDPSKGFSDPRTDEELKNAPRPPSNVTYNQSGGGAKIEEAPSAQRYPYTLDEPTSSRLTRNEFIEKTIVQQKRDNVVSNVPVGTGGLAVPGVDVAALLRIQATLPAISIPRITAGFNISGGFEICGLGINFNLGAFASLGGFDIVPTITLDGLINFGTISLDTLMAIEAAIDAATFLIDLVGCLITGHRIGSNMFLDGGLVVPLLPPGVTITTALVTRGTVIGGVPLGYSGGIPLSTQPYWNEPDPPYNAQYPYNRVYESESGHVFEVDDTPGHERIHNYHRSGTFDEIGPDGSKVTKVVKDKYEITLSDNNIMIMGDCNVTVKGRRTNMIEGDEHSNIEGENIEMVKRDKTTTIMGSEKKNVIKDQNTTVAQNKNDVTKGISTIIIEKDSKVLVKGKHTLAVGGDGVIAVAGLLTIGSQTDVTIIAKENMAIVANKDLNIKVKGKTKIESDEDVTIKGKNITLEATTGHIQTTSATAQLDANPVTIHNADLYSF